VDAVSAALVADHLYRFYHIGDDETLALRGVSFEVDEGEVVAITGPSGSGKSTLLACVAGLDEPDGGTVHVAGERLTRRSESRRAAIRASSIGMLFQSNNLVDHLDVRGNVRLAQRLANRVDEERASRVIDEVGLTPRAHALPTQLSGGEVARAGLAVALANAPRLILADEPTGELDRANAQRLVALLRRSAVDGAAVVMVTHDAEVALAADRRIELVDGSRIA
jgi:putative ABC transport system ATP-binding protein